MQEQFNKDEQTPPQEEPLSSEAPDTLQPAEENPITPEIEETEAANIAEDVEPSSEELRDEQDEPAGEQAEASSEQPDGEVAQEADDFVADANAVDPKIDIGLLEAYLFSTHSPLTPGRLAELFNLESTKPIRKALRVLNEQYEQSGRCFRVEQVAGGFQLLTLPNYGDHLKALHQREADAKLTKAALETLAIIAYKQPILRADLEAIRGVASGETIRSLMEKHLVKIAGRAEEPGRPILYGTTKRFLEVFGLNTLKDLPQPDSPQAKAKQLAQAAQSLLAEPGAEPTETQAAEAQPSCEIDEAVAQEETTSAEQAAESTTLEASQPRSVEPAPMSEAVVEEAPAEEQPADDEEERQAGNPQATPE